MPRLEILLEAPAVGDLFENRLGDFFVVVKPTRFTSGSFPIAIVEIFDLTTESYDCLRCELDMFYRLFTIRAKCPQQ